METFFLMNGTKICQQQIWGHRNCQILSYFGDIATATTPTICSHGHGTLEFKQQL